MIDESTDLVCACAKYILELDGFARRTNYASDRKHYAAHLEVAAVICAELYLHGTSTRVRDLIASERHSYGWGYLQGDYGENAEKAFHRFAALFDS